MKAMLSGSLVAGAAVAACGGRADSGDSSETGAGGAGGTAGTGTAGTAGKTPPTPTPGPTSPPEPPPPDPPPDPPPLPECEVGETRDTCWSLDELVHYVDQNGQLGNPDASIEGGELDPNGCPVADRVANTCCIGASGGPWLDGDRCCYRFCESGCCGRPFLVDGIARVAPLVRRADWQGPPAPPVDTLDAATRWRLAEAWARDARVEHASIASFARFTLDLLALGAPPQLVEASQRAALDEIDHARRCFALAARFSGEPCGPGRLEVGGGAGSQTARGAAVAAVLEGCIGETIAALTAAEQAKRACDEMARLTLEKIAEDEARHSELAWLFVRWAVATFGAEVREAVRSTFDEARSGDRVTITDRPAELDVDAWHAYGRLTEHEAASIERRAWSEVIEPCLQELVGEDRAA